MPQPPRHPYSSVLRLRAANLRELADSIERSLVTTLAQDTDPAVWSTPRAALCESMLARNLHQLHRAADELRDRAFRFRQRADELDATRRTTASA